MSNEEVQQWVREHMLVNEYAPTDEPEFSDHGYSVNVLLDLVEPGWRELVPVPDPITVTIEHNDLKQGWFWRCSVHGKGPLHLYIDGTESKEMERQAHDSCVRVAVSHNQTYHGGNGIVPLHMLT